MKQPKKIFKKLCLNNWGGISHEVLEFHEYVNLFSGKSGSGKSTVMDAIQVILYGSFSSSFLNKAADDAKNRRSVLSYLRGEQKDGSANRAGQDFCTVIALEIEDTGTHIVHCVGLAFEVRKSDTDVRKSTFFSHSGRMPEDGYTNASGVPYTIKEIKELIDERKQSPDNRGKFDVNRTYVTKESYLGVLNDAIMGYVDGPRFTTMEKSAIALRMTNGTGQFIKDYMFPKNNSDAIQNISEELGAYQEIKEQIQDIKARIDALTEIRNHGRKILDAQMDEIKAAKTIQCIDIIQTKQKIQEKSEMLDEIQLTLDKLEKEADSLQEQKIIIEDELIEVSAELKASDLGRKQENLKELEERGEILSSNYGQWKSIVANILKWEQDEIITDYVSNPMLNRISEFANGKVTAESCQTLRENIKSTKENLEVELDDYNDQRRATHKLIEEKQQLIDDIQKNQKSYGEQVRRARTALSQKLSTIYGRSISVQVFADLFDVQGESWKNAIEGRMGRLKTSLITEPQYAHDAAKIFREMKEFEQVELIHSKAVAESNPLAKEGSLYEEVNTEYPYVDKCLQRYLGNVIKCGSVKELEQVRDGVTKDCYAYSNFIFRHLKEKDYTIYACIGTKVSKAKLKGYEEELRELEAEYREQCRMTDVFKHARDFESLTQEPAYLVQLSKSGTELEKVVIEENKLKAEILELQEGACKILEEREKELQELRRDLDENIKKNHTKVGVETNNKTSVSTDIAVGNRDLENLLMGYVPDESLESWVQEEGSKKFSSIRTKQGDIIHTAQEQYKSEKELLSQKRIRYIHHYPNCGFTGAEESNEKYDQQLAMYEKDYEEKYLVQFEEQTALVHYRLKENLLATIHGDIRAAKRHTNEINRLLRNTNFSDSTYQIKVGPAQDENGQFYEMLNAEELDSKNIRNHGMEGQISLGDDVFFTKYEQKIDLLMEKFLPHNSESGITFEQKQKEMDRYSDYRNYLSFSMFEQVEDEKGNVIRENYVDDMAGKDSGGEGQNPKYVALLAGFAMLYAQQSNHEAKIKLVLLDEAFSKMDQERSAVCLKYARQLNLQLIVCVPDERLQSLIRNVDSVYGFRRHQNQIQMMHINKGEYLVQLEGE